MHSGEANKSGGAATVQPGPPDARKRRLDLRALAREAALPVLSGVLYFVSWIGFGVWPLSFICLVPLLLSLRGTSWKGALWRGALMGLVTHMGGYPWLIHMLRVFAFLPVPVAFLGYVLVCAYQGFLFGVFALVVRVVWRRTGWPLTLLVPLALLATEFVYPLLFQSYTGAALLPLLPLVQIADLGGTLLTSALIGLSCGAAFDVLTGSSGRRLVAVALVGVAFGASSAYGNRRLADTAKREQAAPKRRSALAQPNVGEIALHTNPQASVRALWAQTAEAHVRGAELVVWPEVGFNTALVDLRNQRAGTYIQHGIPTSLIAGLERADGEQRFNSAVLIDKAGKLGDHFDKIQLLAFGEYIPFGDVFPIVYQWSPMSSHLTRGTTTAPLRDGPWRYATFICYEDILPRLVQKTMEPAGGGRPHALVNLTNDSWYGTGAEQEEHLMLAAMRSIEHHRWMLRATSTGISAFIDASGRVVQRIPRDSAGVAVRDVPMLEGETAYERYGDWPGWLSLGVLALALAASLRPGRRPSDAAA